MAPQTELPSPVVSVQAISPKPTEAEAKAIALALEQVWPKPQLPKSVDLRWRFSGRSWSRAGNRFRA